MFIEVYIIPTNDWNNPSEYSEKPENRLLIDTHGALIQYSTKCDRRAEIHLHNGEIIHIVGTYDEIIERIEYGIKNNKIKRI